MASKYQNLIDAVMMGNTVAVPCDETSESALRTSLWRELRKVKKTEEELGIDHYASLSIYIRKVGDVFKVKLVDSAPTVTFQILE